MPNKRSERIGQQRKNIYEMFSTDNDNETQKKNLFEFVKEKFLSEKLEQRQNNNHHRCLFVGIPIPTWANEEKISKKSEKTISYLLVLCLLHPKTKTFK